MNMCHTMQGGPHSHQAAPLASAMESPLHELLQQRETQLVFEIGKRRRAEEATRRLQDEIDRRIARSAAELRSTNQALEAFALTLAAAVQAPLRTMNSFVERLQADQRPALDAEGRRCLDHVAALGAQLERLSFDLLRFTRLGSAALDLRPVMLGESLRAAMRMLDKVIAHRGACIAIPELPAVVRADPQLLRHALAAVLSSAIELRRGTGAPRIRIDHETDADCVLLRIGDNSMASGISPSTCDHADCSEPQAADDGAPRASLCLLLAKRFIESMGGEVTAVLPAGEDMVLGAIFTLRLPLAQPRDNCAA